MYILYYLYIFYLLKSLEKHISVAIILLRVTFQ